MIDIDIDAINFTKLDGLVPAIIQDAETKQVLMLGFMNKQALSETTKRERVVFWSRTKQRLWEKGEESRNTLKAISISADCDNDTLLISVIPAGPTCHTGSMSCFVRAVLATPPK